MKKIAIILAMVIGLSSPAYTFPVLIYGGDFDIPLNDPTGPTPALTQAVIDVPDHFVSSDFREWEEQMKTPEDYQNYLMDLDFYIQVQIFNYLF